MAIASRLGILGAVFALALACGAAARAANPTPPAGPVLSQPASLRPPDPHALASDFVRANVRVSEFGYTIRWQTQLCIMVFGLTPKQEAAVTSRIEAIAQTLSEKVYDTRQQCPLKDVSILFTAQPQRVLNAMIARDPRFLGDPHSDTHGIKTVTRPIQAWRETVCAWTICYPELLPAPPIDTTVLVDARRVPDTPLRAIADYVAMLVLADPRNLDHCQVLPSILDLFAGPCPGRARPNGLTDADLAFLRALYTAGGPITRREWNWGEHGGTADQIAGRMAMLLAGHGFVPSPGDKPVLR